MTKPNASTPPKAENTKTPGLPAGQSHQNLGCINAFSRRTSALHVVVGVVGDGDGDGVFYLLLPAQPRQHRHHATEQLERQLVSFIIDGAKNAHHVDHCSTFHS